MDKDRLTTSFRDEIGLAVEAAMAVTPAPGLAAQVRARVDQERAKPMWWRGWRLAAAAGSVALVAALVPLLWPGNRTATDPAAVLAASHSFGVVPYAAIAEPLPFPIAPRALPARASRSLAGAAVPRATATLSPDAAALRAYVDYLRRQRTDGTPAAAVAPAPGQLELPTISLARIAIDPLPKLEAVTGERQ